MLKRFLLIPLILICSCASTYQRMAADNVKDMMVAVKVLDTAYAPFYKNAAESLMTNIDWLKLMQGKSKLEMIQNYQQQMQFYDDTILEMQGCRDQLKDLSKTFDTYKKLPDVSLQKEIDLFAKYKKVLVQMINIKVAVPNSLVSLSTQMCMRNVKIATYFKFPIPDCTFINKTGGTNGSN